MEQTPKDLAISMLGGMFHEMKALDDAIIGPSSTLNRRSDEIKKELTKMVASPNPQPSLVNPPQQEQVIQNVAPVQHSAPVQVPQKDGEMQLEFDLNKAARYEDILEAISKLEKLVRELHSKFDSEIAKKPKKKLDGSSQG